jgi:hypothetical protein
LGFGGDLLATLQAGELDKVEILKHVVNITILVECL